MRLYPFANPQEGGVTTGGPDLWCTYAALRTLHWLGLTLPQIEAERTAAYLSARRNADGGYAWSRGMLSDAWATFYSTQALADLGRSAAKVERTQEWLRSTWSGDAYAMLPGQRPDVWATYFSTRTTIQVCADRPPDPMRLLDWLGALQTSSGGLAWTPEHARYDKPDVRACFYGIMAWCAFTNGQGARAPWDLKRLTIWLCSCQHAAGGFVLNAQADHPCLWATYRATAALAALMQTPIDPAACKAWIMQRRGYANSFVRWDGYTVEDVWAAFSAVGALKALRATTALDTVRLPVSEVLRSMQCEQGGYTYRNVADSADALSTASKILMAAPDDSQRQAHLDWLEACQLPNEGGVMYMPGRGAEVRCTLWALSAGAFRRGGEASERIAHWLRGLQNPDGGFGYWEGRGSDMVSTAAATESLMLLQGRLEMTGVSSFLTMCLASEADGIAVYANVPGGEPTLRSSLQAHRVRQYLGDADPNSVAVLLERHQVPGGGYANTGARIPDLLSTYEAVVAAERFGLPLRLEPLHKFADRISGDDGVAWTPLALPSGDNLANCLGGLLRGRIRGQIDSLPALMLS